jgi:hypothetical protein
VDVPRCLERPRPRPAGSGRRSPLPRALR